MAKNKNNNFWWIIVGIIVLSAGFYALYQKDNNVNAGAIILSDSTPIATPTPTPQTITVQSTIYTIDFYFSMTEVCSGQQSVGHIDTNINNGMCTIYVKNGNNWDATGTLNLNPSGDFSDSVNFDNVGAFTYKTVCCDANSNCKMSNEASILVKDCTQPIVQTASYCCNANGQAGCYEGGCPQGAQQLGGGYELAQQCMNSCSLPAEPAVPQTGCTDTDYASGYPNYLTTTGTCTFNGEFITDTCQDSNFVMEYTCEPLNNPTGCGYTTVNCPAVIPGSVCSGGKCVVQTCQQVCDAQQGYSTGGCFVYNSQGALSMAQTCTKNTGTYLGLTGSDCDDSSPLTPEICCCR